MKSMIETSSHVNIQRQATKVAQRIVSDDIMKLPTEIAEGQRKLKYGDAYNRNLQYELAIGESLSNNGKLTEIAEKIREASNVENYNKLVKGSDSQKHAEKEAQIIGGADTYVKGEAPTLDSSVFAVVNEIEKTGENKAKYSTVREDTNNPYFVNNAKKPEFDKPLSSALWSELPEDCKKVATDYKDSLEPTENGEPKISNVGYNNLSENARKKILEKYTEDRKYLEKYKSHDLDKIKSHGNHINLVSYDQPDNPQSLKDKWIKATIEAGKPIISGPSGHTLRYLNFWVEKRNQAKQSGGTELNTNEYPSLQAARLVMLGNLMPPKMHHSYDEVMTASIGIKGNDSSESLSYNHKENYEDLQEQKETDAKPIADRAYHTYKTYERESSGFNMKEEAIKKCAYYIDFYIKERFKDSVSVDANAIWGKAVELMNRNTVWDKKFIAYKIWELTNSPDEKANYYAACKLIENEELEQYRIMNLVKD